MDSHVMIITHTMKKVKNVKQIHKQEHVTIYQRMQHGQIVDLLRHGMEVYGHQKHQLIQRQKM